MKLSAFPTRDWKRILPQLESLPEDVEFVAGRRQNRRAQCDGASPDADVRLPFC